MLVLIGIGLVAGLVTALSPCVLPVLPILLAGGATGRKPLRIVTGLVLSFTVFTLFAARLLDALSLPADFLRNLALALLFLLAATLLFPPLGALLERPFAALTRYRAGGGGFLLGASLGLVFVPCAGPVLAAVTAVAASNDVGLRALALTLAYAVGAALPMLLVIVGGRSAASRLRAHAPRVRIASGILVALAAVGIALHYDERFQTALPGYTDALGGRVEKSGGAERELGKLRGGGGVVEAAHAATGGGLEDYGRAPELHPGGRWFNSKPLTLASLRGRVVLVDFWTYSCINCLRTLPHLRAWDAAYRSRGLTIVGVHTPEFAFEHDAGNVEAAVKRLKIRYPVVQDNDFATWNAYANRYWPAKYLIDRAGHVRFVHFGEGSYGETEGLIRRLLGIGGGRADRAPDTTPGGVRTPESYLGYERIARYAGSTIGPDRLQTYSFPKRLSQNSLAYGGEWRVQGERIVAGRDARLRLRFFAQDVYLVLGGRGRVDVLVDGRHTRTVPVDSYRLYTLRTGPLTDALLELRVTPGVAAYAFTFG
jgi:cytochrome c biogenesis protein CcdA/thiol-disulfide isomerase/thioredoxin